ncbi:AraC family transcriptional regulator [Paenibacillus glycanilyticus]|uniref:AraC family transcriptional regulator n=1 Tax=Paenibacillus glycanilyticus TaxID=126569 RepID=A0ABQ6GCY5_9BACL|nr:AraC family transcriptional regulator [Paenibacillus glycanilyticus]GLX66937.1 AraC family transcriptional regulator [Paenibacillus glycanilyticus]
MVDIIELANDVLLAKLEIAGVYRVKLPPNQSFGNVNIKQAGFLFILRGEAEFSCDGESYRLTPGLMLHGMKDMHLKYTTGRDEEFEYILVNYRGMTKEQQIYQHLNGHFVMNIPMSMDMSSRLLFLHSISLDPDSISALKLNIAFMQLMLDIFEQTRQQSSHNRSHLMVEDTLAYIHEHYMSPISLASLAARYKVSEGFFSFKFRNYTGISPIEYLLRFRINRSRELLATNQFTVREVARQVGYADAYYFSRLFKKHTGIAPSQLLTNRLL